MSPQAFSPRGRDLAMQRDFGLKPRKPAYPPGLKTQRLATDRSSVKQKPAWKMLNDTRHRCFILRERGERYAIEILLSVVLPGAVVQVGRRSDLYPRGTLHVFHY